MVVMNNWQAGNVLIKWVFNLFIAGLLLSVVVKIMPFYMDDSQVEQDMSTIVSRLDFSGLSASQIQRVIVEEVKSKQVKLKRDEVSVYREQGVISVSVNYERRLHFFSNVDLALTFKHNWKVGSQ